MNENACRTLHCGFDVYVFANTKGWRVEIGEYAKLLYAYDGVADLLKAIAIGFAVAEYEAARRGYVLTHGYDSDKVLAVLGVKR